MKIIACFPGEKFSGRFLMSVIQLTKECIEAKIELSVTSTYNPVVSFCRNSCIGGNVMLGATQKPFGGKVEYDYMLWIDSDIAFDVVKIRMLIDAAKKYGGIVSGIYKMADNKHFAVSREFYRTYLSEHGRYPFLTAETMPKDDFNADGIGLGFCMVEYGVFESITYPWFRHNAISAGPVHDFLSEDFSFCEMARDAGNEITVIPSIRVGHEKTVIM